MDSVREKFKQLVSEVNQLPAPYQDILRLYYNENLTQNEIAERMGISPYQVKIYISKGKFLFRKVAEDAELTKAKEILYKKD